MDDDKKVIGIVLAGIVGAFLVFSLGGTDDDSTQRFENEPERENVKERVMTYETYEEDGYAWAEENDISSFDECQDQFGTSYEEDECNRYVQENYSGYDTFYGYDCTEDCSGHEAGYAWAEENGIYDEYDCDGNSNSFNEGCTAYVQENY